MHTNYYNMLITLWTTCLDLLTSSLLCIGLVEMGATDMTVSYAVVVVPLRLPSCTVLSCSWGCMFVGSALLLPLCHFQHGTYAAQYPHIYNYNSHSHYP